MADIFGKEREFYSVVRAHVDAGTWDRQQASVAQRWPNSAPQHDFNAYGGGTYKPLERATEDQQALGYVTNNMLAIQTMIDEIMYTAFRLPTFVHLNTNIPEGARTYGVPVMDRVGQADRVSAPGYDAPSATISETLVTQPIHVYGLDAQWSISELRSAMFANIPLNTYSIEAAVTGTLERMESLGLTGGYGTRGLLNQMTGTGDMVQTSASTNAFANLTTVQIRDAINDQISLVIENSAETLGRNVSTGMTVYLPGTQYDLLTSRYVGDNAERTIMRTLMEDNPWTHFTKGNPINVERVLELDAARNPNVANDQMVVGLKHERIAEMGVPIMPRVLRILDQGRVITAQVEAEFSPLWVKRPNTIRYLTSI